MISRKTGSPLSLKQILCTLKGKVTRNELLYKAITTNITDLRLEYDLSNRKLNELLMNLKTNDYFRHGTKGNEHIIFFIKNFHSNSLLIGIILDHYPSLLHTYLDMAFDPVLFLQNQKNLHTWA